MRVLPGISLCIISRDNEECIGMCINSVKHIVDQVVVALDDKTVDNTSTIATSCGAEVHPFTFDYFGQARDFSLSFARHEWILVLDGDETINPNDATVVRASLEHTANDAFKFPRRNWRDLDMTELAVFPFTGRAIPYPDYQVRLFRNMPSIRYGDQYVHESPRGYRNLAIIPGDVHINHFQFVYKNEERSQKSFERYTELTERSRKYKGGLDDTK